MKVDEKREDVQQNPQNQQSVPTQNEAPDAKNPKENESGNEESKQQSQILQKAEELLQQPLDGNNGNTSETEPNNAEEGSGEAVIQIEPLLDYIMATGTRANGTVEESDMSGDGDDVPQQDDDDDDKRR